MLFRSPGSSVGGPEFVKNILGPMPWTRIMPTGGVDATEESLKAWFGAGVVAVGIGSNLITKALLDAIPNPTDEQIKDWMLGNLCRCTGYYKIIESIKAAAGQA